MAPQASRALGRATDERQRGREALAGRPGSVTPTRRVRERPRTDLVVSAANRHEALPVGRYAIVDGHELMLFATMGEPGYKLLSPGPQPGFHRDEHGRYVRTVRPEEQLTCVDYRNHGTYRGIAVHVSPNGVGNLVIHPSRQADGSLAPDDALQAAGFEWDGRPGEPWIKIVAPDDPDMEVVTTRTPIDPPWITMRQPSE